MQDIRDVLGFSIFGMKEVQSKVNWTSRIPSLGCVSTPTKCIRVSPQHQSLLLIASNPRGTKPYPERGL